MKVELRSSPDLNQTKAYTIDSAKVTIRRQSNGTIDTHTLGQAIPRWFWRKVGEVGEVECDCFVLAKGYHPLVYCFILKKLGITAAVSGAAPSLKSDRILARSSDWDTVARSAVQQPVDAIA